MAKKKATRKKAAKASTAPTTSHALMVPLPDDLFTAFHQFRADRKATRSFPWTVRDCMQVAIEEYLAKHGK